MAYVIEVDNSYQTLRCIHDREDISLGLCHHRSQCPQIHIGVYLHKVLFNDILNLKNRKHSLILMMGYQFATLRQTYCIDIIIVKYTHCKIRAHRNNHQRQEKRITAGKLGNKDIMAMQGRFHYYEGHDMKTVALPVRVMQALGVKTLILTNAAGGVNTSYDPGTLMLISDHINYSGANPLIGPNLDTFGPRFPDMSDLYTASLRAAIKEKAAEAGIPLQEGVYAMYSGPNYETPAEIRMFRVLGADTVGMSTVPEALVAGHSGMQVVGVSCVTNMAAGVLPVKLSHAEVTETANRVSAKFRKLIDLILTVI